LSVLVGGGIGFTVQLRQAWRMAEARAAEEKQARQDADDQREKVSRLAVRLAQDKAESQKLLSARRLWLARALSLVPTDAGDLEQTLRRELGGQTAFLPTLVSVSSQSAEPITALALSSDEKCFLAGCQDGTARLHDVATGQPIGPVLKHPGAV